MKSVVAAVGLLIAACGASSDTASPEPLPPVVPPEVSDEVIGDAEARVAIPAEDIQIVSVEPMAFEDTSFGCADESREYQPVQMSGFQMILEAGDGQLDYRIGESGEFLLCLETTTVEILDTTDDIVVAAGSDNPPKDGGEALEEETGATLPTPPGMPAAILEQIIADAAQTASVPIGEVSVASSTTALFNDGSLGCPKKDHQYIQVQTPGWVILISAGATNLEYHASENSFVLCS